MIHSRKAQHLAVVPAPPPVSEHFLLDRLRAVSALTERAVSSLADLSDTALRALANATDAELKAVTAAAERGREVLERRLDEMAVGASIEATFLTVSDESEHLPNSRQLTAGRNVTLDRSQPGLLIPHADAYGGAVVQSANSAAPAVQYFVQLIEDARYENDVFIRGTTIIGVRFPGPAVVRLPHDLLPERIVTVKAEMGSVVVKPW